MRVGHGFDVHRFGIGKDLVIGGVKIPFEQGIIAHSDGDVAIHALCDALLGAAALGDIGQHFPDTDLAFENADSQKLLQHVMNLVHQQNLTLSNGDITIVAQKPKLAAYIPSMKETLAPILGIPSNRLNIKATTTEKMGYIGRVEGIAAHAVVLLKE
ncbi:2-C-methyl-D-erythritol 2,4-cyclodiphosphate synthase [Candidatus Nitrosacidococcus sp. I8]|uniref:2-C-methyl-D-erythritol 2,4-cyclodiphosphate synthase n=1 Tax=Candidatus Nitrosacidococcus sp. I8 TaxID=2942908 RepID=UPI002225C936|nr:2-C-methyl-D-erythritol 2,4-cyclodiphosphate synthase [Candidatus Nitrosacidococcus sp. I8]CAH9018235.1 2-C-methyl-D-erythritol 2,4-cyclodiphosphate synthase [Candidatus Nitrosacidococcus sp. I8]